MYDGGAGEVARVAFAVDDFLKKNASLPKVESGRAAARPCKSKERTRFSICALGRAAARPYPS